MPEHTWTTLQDKSLSLEQIDKVCDLHFVYMGYGKFGHITHKSTLQCVGSGDPVRVLCLFHNKYSAYCCIHLLCKANGQLVTT